MTELTREEKEKIFLEEKERQAARDALSKENPEKNKKAKDGLVLALGSILVGYLFGIPAMAYGISGLNYAKKYPKAGGKGLSIFNLTLGTITTAVSAYFTYIFFTTGF